jgi:uncharacterized membrane protein
MKDLVRRIGLFHAATLLAMLAITAWAWGRIPPGAQIPTHWNAAGEVDGTSGRAFGLLIIPGVSLVIFALFMVVPSIEPRRRHLEQSASAYAVVWAGVATLMLIIHAIVVAAALGHSPVVAQWMPGLIGALFLAMAYVLPRIQSNFMLGIRTPWTLSSEYSWRQTHLAARWVFGVVGVLLIGLAVIGAGDAAFTVTIVAAVAGAVGLFAYSFITWRQDPERSR